MLNGDATNTFLLCEKSLLAALPYFTSELLLPLQFYSLFCYQSRNDHPRSLPSISFCVAINPGRWEMGFHLNAVDQTVKELLLANLKMLHIFSSSLFFRWWWKRWLFKISFAYVSVGIIFFMAALKGTISCTPCARHTHFSQPWAAAFAGVREEWRLLFLLLLRWSGAYLKQYLEIGKFPQLTRIFTQAWFLNSAGWQRCITNSWRIYWFFGLTNEGQRFLTAVFALCLRKLRGLILGFHKALWMCMHFHICLDNALKLTVFSSLTYYWEMFNA